MSEMPYSFPIWDTRDTLCRNHECSHAAAVFGDIHSALLNNVGMRDWLLAVGFCSRTGTVPRRQQRGCCMRWWRGASLPPIVALTWTGTCYCPVVANDAAEMMTALRYLTIIRIECVAYDAP